jgi:SAM-dependent methyltransferase
MAAGLPLSLVADMRCPFCGAGLRPILRLCATDRDLTDGILQCDCYSYPVVSGIAVLRQLGSVSSTRNEAVERLRAGDVGGARQYLLTAAIAPGISAHGDRFDDTSMLRKLARKAWSRVSQPSGDAGLDDTNDSGGFEPTLRARRHHHYADYLYHRFANQSFLASIPAVAVLARHRRSPQRSRVLELLCGVGHLSAAIRSIRPDIEIVMTDIDFVNLDIAQRFVEPGAAALCIDVELPLPFADRAFGAVYCLDGLHYVHSKVALLREVDRVIDGNGAWLFMHMHNADGENVNAGAPLTARGYSARFDFGLQRLVPEAAIVEQFRRDGSLDLTDPAPESETDASAAVTLFGARDGAMWKRHEMLDEAFGRRHEHLWLNPLYTVEKTTDGLTACARWPSDAIRAEFSGKVMLPDTVHLTADVLAEIAAARRTGTLSANVRKMVRSFILVYLPGCYFPFGFSL